jgi:hypothetical protein
MTSKNKKTIEINYKPTIINALCIKYDFGKMYINQIIDGERTPKFADRIKADYDKMKAEMEAILLDNDIE